MTMNTLLCEKPIGLVELRLVYESDDENDHDLSSQAYDIANQEGIYITRNKDTYMVAIANDTVVGATFIGSENVEYDDEDNWKREYWIDIVVLNEYQGNGIGTHLLSQTIESIESESAMYGFECIIKMYCATQSGAALAERVGFFSESEHPNGDIVYEWDRVWYEENH